MGCVQSRNKVFCEKITFQHEKSILESDVAEDSKLTSGTLIVKERSYNKSRAVIGDNNSRRILSDDLPLYVRNNEGVLQLIKSTDVHIKIVKLSS
jgi:hypothetical protein